MDICEQLPGPPLPTPTTWCSLTAFRCRTGQKDPRTSCRRTEGQRGPVSRCGHFPGDLPPSFYCNSPTTEFTYFPEIEFFLFKIECTWAKSSVISPLASTQCLCMAEPVPTFEVNISWIEKLLHFLRVSPRCPMANCLVSSSPVLAILHPTS